MATQLNTHTPWLLMAPDDDAAGGDGPGGGGGTSAGGALDTVLPVLPLRNSVLYPGALMPLAVGRPKTLKLLNAVGTGGTIAVVSQRD
jgi:ATP-dependent Lon protease